VPIVLKSVSLNLLEPSGPVKACNGIDLPLLRIDCSDVQCSVYRHSGNLANNAAGEKIQAFIAKFYSGNTTDMEG
jgi:hypothetical protein